MYFKSTVFIPTVLQSIFSSSTLQKQEKNGEVEKADAEHIFSLAFKSNAPKTGRGLSFLTPAVQHLIKHFLFSRGGSVQERSTTWGACLSSAGAARAWPCSGPVP